MYVPGRSVIAPGCCATTHHRLKLVLGALALSVAAGTLLAILLPHALTLLSAWCVVEVVFWVFVSRPDALELDAQHVERPKLTDQEISKAFGRFIKYCKDTPGGIDHGKYLSGWFLGADTNSIRRDNIEDFVAYGFCYKSRDEMRAAGQGEVLSRMMDQLQTVWGTTPPTGYNPDIQFMAHLREPLNPAYRPLLFYLITDGVAWCSRLLLRRWGFQHHRHAGVNYHTLHLQPPGPAATSKHHINSSCGGTLRQNGTTNSSTSTGSQLGACSSSPFYVAAADHTAGLPAAAALAPAVAGGAAAIAASVSSPGQQPQRAQKSLHPIQEQGAGQQADYDDCSSTSSSRRGSGLSPQISVPGVDVDVSPFASADSAKLSGQLSDTVVVRAAAVGAGNGHTTAANGAAVPAAGAAGCQKSFSVPAARLTGDQQPAQQLPASSSIPARVFAPKSSFRLGQVMTTPLQDVLSEALSEAAGGVEAGIPVVFLHGIGGLPAYLELLLHLMAGGNPLLAVEVKSVAMRLGRVYSVSEVAEAVCGMMDKMGVKQACFVAHSYGTFVASYLSKHHRERVKGCVLIDPVCLGMFMPTLIYNFLYKQAVWQGFGKPEVTNYIKTLVRSGISSEVHVRASVARRFWWTEMNAWPEDLPAGSTILLSGKDDLMDSPEVRVMLQGARHLKVIYNTELAHGAFLLDAEVKKAIKDELRALLATSGSAVVGLAQQLSHMVHPGMAAAAAAAGAVLPSRASIALQHLVLREVRSMHVGSSSSLESDLSDTVRQAPHSFTEGSRPPSLTQPTKLGAEKSWTAGTASGDAGCDVSACATGDQTSAAAKKTE